MLRVPPCPAPGPAAAPPGREAACSPQCRAAWFGRSERAHGVQLGLRPTQRFGPRTVAGLWQDGSCVLRLLCLEAMARGWQHLR